MLVSVNSEKFLSRDREQEHLIPMLNIGTKGGAYYGQEES